MQHCAGIGRDEVDYGTAAFSGRICVLYKISPPVARQGSPVSVVTQARCFRIRFNDPSAFIVSDLLSKTLSSETLGPTPATEDWPVLELFSVIGDRPVVFRMCVKEGHGSSLGGPPRGDCPLDRRHRPLHDARLRPTSLHPQPE